ncbi:conjugal transfer protein TraH [uncultured Microbulbifer sp.]|uniref:conjugal transfer protein TraH n=1 Tax=uncultured Microbulbifer sp. TaxID=348147 RepID=UPI00260738A7|nr:conjugal transfer protein TraH [uncultured Microbulbifer sp.]
MTQKLNYRVSFNVIRTLISALALTVLDAQADVGSKVQEWFNEQNYANVTAPGVYEGQKASYFTAGSANWRSHQKKFNLYNFSTPNVSAGCGGIDLYTGGFSAINADEFVESLRAVGENSLGLLFMLGIGMVSPKLKELIEEMKTFANKYRQFAGDSCAMAQQLLGGGLEAMGMANSDCIIQRMNNNGEDYITAQERCGGGGQGATTLNNNPDAGEVGFVEGNMMWYFLMDDPFFTNDLDIAELIMNLTGTYIKRRPDPNSNNFSFNTLSIPPVKVSPDGQLTGRAKELFAVLLKGTESPNSFSMFRCAEDRTTSKKGCWDLSDSPVVYNKNFTGIETLIRNELANIVESIRDDTPLNNTAVGIIRSTSYPIYRYLRSVTANMPISYSADMMVGDLSEPIADSILSEKLVEILEHAQFELKSSKYGNGTDQSDTLYNNIDGIIEGLQARQVAVDERMDTYFEMVQRAQLFDKALMGRLAAGFYATANTSF